MKIQQPQQLKTPITTTTSTPKTYKLGKINPNNNPLATNDINNYDP